MDKIMKFYFGTNNAEGYTNVRLSDGYSVDKGFGYTAQSDISPEPAAEEDHVTCRRTDVPLCFDVYVGDNGTYDVRIKTVGKGGKMTVFSQNRRFMRTDLDMSEDRQIEFTVSVCDEHKRDCDYKKSDRVSLMFMGNVAVASVEIEKTDAPTIYMAGDSTVTDQPAEYPYSPDSTYCGWGQMLGEYLRKGIAVSNHAQSGSTTQEFKECNWLVVKERLKKGDMLFVEFGHNDQKVESLDAFGGYAKNLRYYVNEAKAVGAYPVLCTPMNRIIFQEDGSLLDLLGEYRRAVIQTAEEMGVPYIDMWKKTTDYFVADGVGHAWTWFWNKGNDRDYTHTNDFGGSLVAKFGAQEIIDKQIQPVCEFIRSQHITTVMPKAVKAENTDYSAAMKHISSIGIVNAPHGVIPDIDKDIRNI